MTRINLASYKKLGQHLIARTATIEVIPLGDYLKNIMLLVVGKKSHGDGREGELLIAKKGAQMERSVLKPIYSLLYIIRKSQSNYGYLEKGKHLRS